MVSASRTASLLALRNPTLVAPSRPQAPCTGANVAGSVRTNSSCCSGVSFTMPQPLRGQPSVAKIKAMARNSRAVMGLYHPQHEERHWGASAQQVMLKPSPNSELANERYV